MLFATAARLLPTFCAMSSWLQTKLMREAGKGVRFFDRIQVFPLEILDQSQLEDVLIGRGADDDRRLGQPDALRRRASGVRRR